MMALKELWALRQGIDSVNENREKLKEFCDFNEMVITGTIFQHKEIHKLKWVSPMEKFKSSVIDTRVMRSADVASEKENVNKPKRWYEHFNEVLNRKNPINPVNMAR